MYGSLGMQVYGSSAQRRGHKERTERKPWPFCGLGSLTLNRKSRGRRLLLKGKARYTAFAFTRMLHHCGHQFLEQIATLPVPGSQKKHWKVAAM